MTYCYRVLNPGVSNWNCINMSLIVLYYSLQYLILIWQVVTFCFWKRYIMFKKIFPNLCLWMLNFRYLLWFLLTVGTTHLSQFNLHFIKIQIYFYISFVTFVSVVLEKKIFINTLIYLSLLALYLNKYEST